MESLLKPDPRPWTGMQGLARKEGENPLLSQQVISQISNTLFNMWDVRPSLYTDRPTRGVVSWRFRDLRSSLTIELSTVFDSADVNKARVEIRKKGRTIAELDDITAIGSHQVSITFFHTSGNEGEMITLNRDNTVVQQGIKK